MLLDTKNMLDFCRKSGHFSGTRKRREIRVLSDGHSMLLGKSYRMLLQQNEADPELTDADHNTVDMRRHGGSGALGPIDSRQPPIGYF